MRNLFIVLAKLAGLLQLYWGISYVAALVTTFRQMSQMHLQGTSSAGGGPMNMSPIIGFSLLTLGLAYLLMFHTNGLANILGIRDEHESNKLSTSQVLKTGVKLIGVYIAANAIPEVFKSLSEWIMTSRQYASGGVNDEMYTRMFRIAIAKGFVSTILPSLLELCIGVFAAVKTDIIIRYITKDKKAEQIAAPLSSEGAPSDEG